MKDKPEAVANEAASTTAMTVTAAADARKPYEAPRLLKKRSVAQATLLTATGPTSTGLPSMG